MTTMRKHFLRETLSVLMGWIVAIAVYAQDTNITRAELQKMIDDCSAQGGGTVIVGQGDHYMKCHWR